MPKGKVLSVQSYVVSSYVGGKSATLILQTRGYDVDSIYSVIYSNHTEYAKLFGRVEEEKDFHELYSGLRHNRLNNYDIIISGFMKSFGFASYLSKVVRELKQQNPKLTYIFDPVLGDNGKFYCPESFIKLYKNELLPIADVITPNQFEAEKLSGITINDKESAIAACQQLHRLGAKTVIISSAEELSAFSNILTCVLSDKCEQGNYTEIKTTFIYFPKVDSSLTGTGDSFSALVISAFMSKGFPTSFSQKIDAVCQSLTCMLKIIERSTLIDAEKKPNKFNVVDPSLRIINNSELALSDCIDILLDETTVSGLLTLDDVFTTKL